MKELTRREYETAYEMVDSKLLKKAVKLADIPEEALCETTHDDYAHEILLNYLYLLSIQEWKN